MSILHTYCEEFHHCNLISVHHSYYQSRHHRRSAEPSGYGDRDFCKVNKRVICEKVPIIEEVIKDVETCESIPREVTDDTNIKGSHVFIANFNWNQDVNVFTKM